MTRAASWTTEEIELLKRSVIPEGRSVGACHTKAGKLRIPFRPSGYNSAPRKYSDEKRKEIADHAAKNGNKLETGRVYGVSRNYVYECCKEFRPDCIGESGLKDDVPHVMYEGYIFSYKKRCWICTSSKVRVTGKYNLAKIIYEKAYGEYPDKHFDVVPKDGNIYNLAPENLVKRSKSESQRIRMQDPIRYANSIANTTYGRLKNIIAEKLDPSKMKARMDKSNRTKKERYAPHEIGRKIVETKRRNAEARGYWYTPEQRKRMSEAHVGKTKNKTEL